MRDFESRDAGSIPAIAAKPCITCNAHQRVGRKSYCRTCWNERSKAYNKAHPESIRASGARQQALRKAVIIDRKNVPCADCGGTFPPYVMDFDHMENKEFLISKATNKRVSIPRLMAEIAKCEVVCANCHRVRTFRQR